LGRVGLESFMFLQGKTFRQPYRGRLPYLNVKPHHQHWRIYQCPPPGNTTHRAKLFGLVDGRTRRPLNNNRSRDRSDYPATPLKPDYRTSPGYGYRIPLQITRTICPRWDAVIAGRNLEFAKSADTFGSHVGSGAVYSAAEPGRNFTF
jgi:hypothetical protein